MKEKQMKGENAMNQKLKSKLKDNKQNNANIISNNNISSTNNSCSKC